MGFAHFADRRIFALDEKEKNGDFRFRMSEMRNHLVTKHLDVTNEF